MVSMTMRPLDELARLWNDTRSRLPQGGRSHVVWPSYFGWWSWPLVAAGTAALAMTIVPPSPERQAAAKPHEANAHMVAAPVVARDGCEDQTWPFFNDDCLRRRAAAGPAQVRVIHHDPAMAAAAIGATQWAPKANPTSKPKSKPSSRKPSSRRKQMTHDPDRSRTVTVRSGRPGRKVTRERVYVVPGGSAYRAYGYAPR
jgi:hypothetical protein